ncbi:MAG: Lrp/AsnC family transcriptional regulator [Acidobacteriaceae bacterium]
MKNTTAKFLDSIGWKILVHLQQNARIPFAELGRRVGLSTPAVMERIRRMEEAGIISGYQAEIDLSKIGYNILAFIRVSVVGNFMPRIMKVARDMPEVLECHRVTGADSFIMKAAVESIDELEKLLDRLTPYVATTTSIVLSSVVTRRVIEPRKSRRNEPLR